MFAAYLITGLVGIGMLCWLLYQANLRHRRVQAELVRLDRLAAEVTLHAEAVLDQVDERIAQLQKLMDAGSAQAAAAAAAASAPAARHTAPPMAPPPPAYRPAPEPAPAVQPPQESDTPRYSELRTQVTALAERGVAVGQIAQMLGIPRGEVSLILNLNKKKASA